MHPSCVYQRSRMFIHPVYLRHAMPLNTEILSAQNRSIAIVTWLCNVAQRLEQRVQGRSSLAYTCLHLSFAVRYPEMESFVSVAVLYAVYARTMQHFTLHMAGCQPRSWSEHVRSGPRHVHGDHMAYQSITSLCHASVRTVCAVLDIMYVRTLYRASGSPPRH